jgi:exopolyphosphatase/guanosine-5'-triphosphate,3'-diphosphate pyrophosphatase
VRVHLVRHAKAEKRAQWDGPDALRPLTPLGLRQARALARRLAGGGVDRILSSPHLRCRQTVAPLAAATGLPVEVHECLAEGEPPAKAVELLGGLRGASVVCCTHVELVDDLAGELPELGLEVCRPPREAEAAEGAERRRLAVLDMGSTSFHLLVADVTPSGRLRPVDRERRQLRLGSVVAVNGHVPEAIGDLAVRTARRLRRLADRFGAERIAAVATAALRDADNGAALAARIAEAVGTPVRLLSGEEEARLMFAAFRRRVLLPRHAPALGVDLGGGSLELVVGDEERVAWERTLPLGVARLHSELARHDPLDPQEARRVAERVRAAVDPLVPEIRRFAPALCVLSGGTARALAHLAVAQRGLRPARSINELTLGAAELRRLTDLLVASSHEKRLRLPGMRRRRADLLPVGALILCALAEAVGVEDCTVPDGGLREGVLLEAVAG